MIKTGEFLPRFCGMAYLAARQFPFLPGVTHQLVELALVRICVASCAGEAAPVIKGSGWLESRRGLVTITADNRLVTSGQRKLGLLVPGKGEDRRLKPLQAMTPFTAVEVGRGGELSGMWISMAIGATLEADFENGAFALGQVTVIARHGGVLPLQRIRGCRVFFQAEGGGFEAIYGVAGGALPMAGPLGKLAAVGIGMVTVHALLENKRLLEIAAGVALQAIHSGMFTKKRKFCFGMIEART